MNELNSATVNALKLTLGNKAFFSVKEVANIMCVSVNKINEMKIRSGEKNNSGKYRIIFDKNKAGKFVTTRDEVLKAIDYDYYV